MLFRLSTILISLSLSMTPAGADPLPGPWQAKREALSSLGSKACNSKSAMDTLKGMVAQNGDAVAAHWVYYTMLSRRCSNWSGNDEEMNAYLAIAVDAGYPVSLRYYGRALIEGTRIPQDVAKGVKQMERARDAGLGQAAAELAWYQSDGKYMAPDLAAAEENYRFALQEGLSAADQRNMANLLPNSVINKAKKPGPLPTQDQRLFAALSVENETGTFGFAFDQPSEALARARARQECESRGGAGCSDKLVLRGPACIAYHSNPGSSAFGWGYSKDQGAAQSRAAQECSERNGGTCNSDAWSCNTRSGAETDVVYEAENDLTVPAAEGCRQLFIRLECYTDNAKEETDYRAGPFAVDYPGCKTDENGAITYKYKKDGFEEWGKQLSPEGLKVARPYLERMKVFANDLRGKCRPNRIWVSISDRVSPKTIARSRPGAVTTSEGFIKSTLRTYGIELPN